MSVAAVILCKDEDDVVGFTVAHLLSQVDEVIVADNGSTDLTRPILEALADRHPGRLIIRDDPVVAYMQSEKTTGLALEAFARGHTWVVPVDADELWRANDGRRLGDWLDGVPPDVRVVRADLYNHLPTGLDGDDPNPFERIGWRQRQHAPLGKVTVRCGPDVVIHQGNHSCYVDGRAITIGGLQVRHYSWRSAAQYLRKIRNGSAAYAATGLPESVGAHWRMFDGAEDIAIEDHFRRWFWVERPEDDPSLIYDPPPLEDAG